MALLLLSGGGALSQESRVPDPARTVPVPQVGLPGVFGSGNDSEGIRLAQAGDPRVTALEEQIRQLNGTLEELNFQVLQMQEQLRKMQEDNEFRFQELEQKKSGARTGDTNRSVAAAGPSTGSGAADPATTPNEVRPDATAAAPGEAQGGRGEPPKNFGTIVFDADGNVKGGSIGDQMSAGAPAAGQDSAPASGGDQVAALPSTDDPDELYRNAYEFILSGDYKTAEAGFRDHISRFPADPKAADAHFWLGESLLGQQKYRDAAEVFLAASKDYPSSKKGPEMLLKLGISLSGLKQRDVACATFGEVAKRYPNASAQLKERVKKEQAAVGC
ncbi:tol-pal system protein YbgF [Mesorhizobium sp. 1B3]|uniref:tol-pal system protein YbgF n=1 Tax=Mesorhizobium sp. 1B3 TaxID=3243599 RepID=UPI003D960C77